MKQEKVINTTDILLGGKLEEHKRTFIVADDTRDVFAYAPLFDAQTLLCAMIDGIDMIIRGDNQYLPLSWVISYLSESKSEEKREWLENIKKLQAKVLECYDKGPQD